MCRVSFKRVSMANAVFSVSARSPLGSRHDCTCKDHDVKSLEITIISHIVACGFRKCFICKFEVKTSETALGTYS